MKNDVIERILDGLRRYNEGDLEGYPPGWSYAQRLEQEDAQRLEQEDAQRLVNGWARRPSELLH